MCPIGKSRCTVAGMGVLGDVPLFARRGVPSVPELVRETTVLGDLALETVLGELSQETLVRGVAFLRGKVSAHRAFATQTMHMP